MCINFDHYPPYTSAISVFFTNINAQYNCCRGFSISNTSGESMIWINKESWEMLKTFTCALTVNKCPNTTVRNSCKYVYDEIKKI